MKKNKNGKSSVHSIWALTIIPGVFLLLGVLSFVVAFRAVPFLASMGVKADAELYREAEKTMGHAVPFFTAIFTGGGFAILMLIGILLIILSLISFIIALIICISSEVSAKKHAVNGEGLAVREEKVPVMDEDVSMARVILPLIFGIAAVLLPVIGLFLLRLPIKSIIGASCLSFVLALVGFVIAFGGRRFEEYKSYWIAEMICCGVAILINVGLVVWMAASVVKMLGALRSL